MCAVHVKGKERCLEKAIDALEGKFPNLKISGIHSGSFNGQPEIDSGMSDINLKKPNMLVLGMGKPLREEWLMEYLSKLHINIDLTGCPVFDYISGNAKMNPDVFYNDKLEWLYRYMCESRRLFKCYVIGNPLFFFRLFVHHLNWPSESRKSY